MLKRVGDSAESLYQFLNEKGFETFLFESKQERFRRTLKIYSHNELLNVEQYDAIFVKSSSDIMQRLQEI